MNDNGRRFFVFSPSITGLADDKRSACQMSQFPGRVALTRIFEGQRRPFANGRGGTVNGFEQHFIVLRIQQSFKLAAACVHPARHLHLADVKCLHGFGDLPRQDTLSRTSGRFLERPLFP